MREKKLVYLFLLVFLAQSVHAVVINEFVVDPQQDWDNSGTITTSDEWFELYNGGLNPVYLAGWKIELLDTTNETENLSGTIDSGSYLVLLNLAGQQNNDGMLILYDNYNNIIDSVAYGNYNDGDLSDNAPDGNAAGIGDECLARVPNAAGSFAKQKCTRSYSNDLVNLEEGGSVSFIISATVEGLAPSVGNIIIYPDDDNLSEGVQITPVPGSNKTVYLQALVSDNSGYENIDSVRAEIIFDSVVIKTIDLNLLQTINSTTAEYSGNFGMEFYREPGVYEISIIAATAQGSVEEHSGFEYLTSIGIESDAESIPFSVVQGTTSYIYGDADMGTSDKPTIKNVGNVLINTEVYGSDLSDGINTIPINNLQYRFGSRAFATLSTNPVINEINLGINENSNLDLSLYVPSSTSSGTYTGSMVITALS